MKNERNNQRVIIKEEQYLKIVKHVEEQRNNRVNKESKQEAKNM